MGEKRRHEFQAEVQQLLDIVVHSIYTDREIFLRELISNAADALEKMRFLSAKGEAIHEPDRELKVKLSADEESRTITLEDSGIGMTEEELIENLGRIAHSGSKAFLKKVQEGEGSVANMIGQFGVGFYSAFMVAEKVQVYTRSYHPDAKGWVWTSTGAGAYEIEPSEETTARGSRIVLTLKEESKEFAEKSTLERIIKRYSNFVSFPIEYEGETVNTVQALWSKSKSEIQEEEYEEFYKFIANAYDSPRYRFHFNADAPLAIKSILFVPQSNFEKMGMGRVEPGVALYCKKVLIEPNAPKLFPEWLRFLKGVVDSEDLPLSVSRETMQDSALMAKLNQVLTGRFIKFLDDESKKDAGKYLEFFKEFGRYIREGIATDYANREALAKLLRYESSSLEPEEYTSLAEYKERMKSDQEEIYFLVGPNRETIEASPYYEAFRSKGLETLFMYDEWDEFVMDHLGEFDGKKVISGEKAKIEIEDDGAERLSEEDARQLCEWMKEILGDRVGEVRTSNRLVGSPAVVTDKDGMTASMRRMMSAMNPSGVGGGVDLEIHSGHEIIRRLNAMRAQEPELAKLATEQVLDNARAAAGLIEDPRTMVSRLNELVGAALRDRGKSSDGAASESS